MNQKEALLAAHVAYEIAQYAPDRLPATVRREMQALYGVLAAVKVKEALTPEGLAAVIRRELLARPLPPEIVDFARENLLVALEIVQDDQTPVRELLPKTVFDKAVAGLAEQDEMRRQIIGQVVRSSVYSRLLANVLYHGIKSFLLAENGMARAIPGAGSLLRLSQNALNATLNAAAPQMEKNVDKQLVAFIDDNIQQLIADSESFLNRSLDDELLQRVGDELWESLGNETPARLTRTLDRAGLAAGGDVLQEAWEHLRGSQLVEDILQAVVRGFFLRYGKQDVAAVLRLMSLDEAAAAQLAVELAGPLVARACENGTLAESARARLAPFYDHYFAEGA